MKMTCTKDQINRMRKAGLNSYESTHLIRWLEKYRTEDDAAESINRILSVLESDRTILDDHSWPELERMYHE